jgi:hypothetical protein
MEKTIVEYALDDVKMDETDQMNFLQDKGYASDNCVCIEDAREDLAKLHDRSEEIAQEFEEYLGEWSFLW